MSGHAEVVSAARELVSAHGDYSDRPEDTDVADRYFRALDAWESFPVPRIAEAVLGTEAADAARAPEGR